MERFNSIIKVKRLSLSRLFSLLALFFCAGSFAVAQELIYVNVKVVETYDEGNGKTVQLPVQNVVVTVEDTKASFGMTDADGKTSNSVFEDAKLVFEKAEFHRKVVKVKGREEIVVVLERKDIFKDKKLGEATVTGENTEGKIVVTVAKTEGNWVRVDLNGISPKTDYMKTDNRWVVQPVAKRLIGNVEPEWKGLTPEVGKVDISYLSPLVVDREEYDKTQDRMYDFDMTQDPLTKGTRIVAVDSMRQSKWIELEDSVKGKYRKKRENRLWKVDGGTSYFYAPDLRDNYVFYVLTAYEDYHKVLRVDTAIRSVGVSRPWRWLEYNFASEEITDSEYLPKEPSNTPQKSEGEVNVLFENGKSDLNLSDSVNLAEVAKMKKDIDLILGQEDAKLMGVSFVGQSSPEGGYQLNLRLANDRLASLRNYFRGQVGAKGAHTRWGANDQAVVATWEQVADVLEEDSLKDEAKAIRDVCAQTSNIDAQSRMIRNFAFYEMLREKYLPRFRTTRYKLNYIISRKRTLDEVRAIYKEKGMGALHEYYAWQLYKNEPDTTKRIEMLRELVADRPKNFFFANDLQVLLIERNNPDPELLKQFVKNKRYGASLINKGVLMPEQVFNNHVIALLHHSRFSAADSVLQGRVMPKTPNNAKLRVFVKVLAGDAKAREKNFEMIASTSPRNRVIMLLMKDTDEERSLKEALSLCTDSLSQSDPITYYLEAVCRSRLKEEEKAEEILRKAIKMRPDLENAARYDGDLSQLPMFKEEWETLFMTPEEIAERERRAEAEFMKFVESVDLSLTFDDVIRIEREKKAAMEAKKKADEEAAEAAAKAQEEKAAKKSKKKGKKSKKAKKTEEASANLPVAEAENGVKAEAELKVAEAAADSVGTPAAEPEKKGKKAKKSKKSKKSKKEEKAEDVKPESETTTGGTPETKDVDTPEAKAEEPAKESEEQKKEEPVAKEEEKTEQEAPAKDETPEKTEDAGQKDSEKEDTNTENNDTEDSKENNK